MGAAIRYEEELDDEVEDEPDDEPDDEGDDVLEEPEPDEPLLEPELAFAAPAPEPESALTEPLAAGDFDAASRLSVR